MTNSLKIKSIVVIFPVRHVILTFTVDSINAIERCSVQINKSGSSLYRIIRFFRPNGVILILIYVPSVNNLDYALNVITNFHVCINELFVDVGEDCLMWR